MKKIALFLISFTFIFLFSQGQAKVEDLKIDWPSEYHWKIVQQSHDGDKQITMIIPGKEKVEKASIIGSMTAYRGMKYATLEEAVQSYKAGIDAGSTLMVLEKDEKSKYPWVLFKIETPKTDKYSEPESDLYYVIQGEYAVYENYVAIKKPSLSPEFVEKWAAIFKTCKITME